jgi:hypothetical protein
LQALTLFKKEGRMEEGNEMEEKEKEGGKLRKREKGREGGREGSREKGRMDLDFFPQNF